MNDCQLCCNLLPTCTFRSANRRGGTAISYKEDSDDDKTGSDEVTEVQWSEATAATAAAAETDTADTIEKVLNMRRGRKGGRLAFRGMLGGCFFKFLFGIRA